MISSILTKTIHWLAVIAPAMFITALTIVLIANLFVIIQKYRMKRLLTDAAKLHESGSAIHAKYLQLKTDLLQLELQVRKEISECESQLAAEENAESAKEVRVALAELYDRHLEITDAMKKNEQHDIDFINSKDGLASIQQRGEVFLKSLDEIRLPWNIGGLGNFVRKFFEYLSNNPIQNEKEKSDEPKPKELP